LHVQQNTIFVRYNLNHHANRRLLFSLFFHLVFFTHRFIQCFYRLFFFFFTTQSSSISSYFLDGGWMTRFFRFAMSSLFFPLLSLFFFASYFSSGMSLCVRMCLETLAKSTHMHAHPGTQRKLTSGRKLRYCCAVH
jgi:hypothetical protein